MLKYSIRIWLNKFIIYTLYEDSFNKKLTYFIKLVKKTPIQLTPPKAYRKLAIVSGMRFRIQLWSQKLWHLAIIRVRGSW